jgi:salicylate hydroxylase
LAAALGGLTLAQGLKKSGVSVAVYERDRTPTDRLQGYRVHINPAGSQALYECLPASLFDAFVRTCGKPSPSIRFLTERMRVLLALDEVNASRRFGGDGVHQHRSVSRITLRRVLLSGLDQIVHFGKTFARYEELPTGRVCAHFEDATSAEGDLLVAADGGGSRVRRQFLPDAERIDTGVVAIAGKVFLDSEGGRQVPAELRQGLTMASDRDGHSLFVALQEIEGVAVDGFGANDASAAADIQFDNSRSYLMWAFGARREKLGLDDYQTGARSHQELRNVVLNAMALRSWDERFRMLVRAADPGTIGALAIRTSVPVAPWPTQRVTLLGDAIHSMTPYRGVGANVALKDAVRLCRALTAVHCGERLAIEAIHEYEAGMLDYGFAAVRASLQAMNQAMAKSRVRSGVSRLVLRVANNVPAFKRAIFDRLGDE